MCLEFGRSTNSLQGLKNNYKTKNLSFYQVSPVKTKDMTTDTDMTNWLDSKSLANLQEGLLCGLVVLPISERKFNTSLLQFALTLFQAFSSWGAVRKTGLA